MKTLRLVICAGLLLGVAATQAVAEDKDEKGFVPMFNGKDLAGWEGKDGGWTVEDGAITGESTKDKPCKRSHYLYWKGGEPGDFVMRCKIKIVGGNSGIQFRSEKRPNFDTFGYQADYDAANRYTGAVYQHARGLVVNRGFRVTISKDGKVAKEQFADAKALARKVKDKDWNDYEIIAIGPKLTLRINGVLMSEATDRDRKQSRKQGIIALQMHQGPPMKVQFKDLRIQVLDKAQRATVRP